MLTTAVPYAVGCAFA